MRLFKRNDNIDNILKDYYKINEDYAKQNIPSLPTVNIIKIDITPGRRLLINTAFTFGIILLSGIVLLTAGNKTEMEILMGKIIENTDVIEHIRSGSSNMFEILSKSFM